MFSQAWQWWRTPLIPALGRQRQADFWVRNGQPGRQWVPEQPGLYKETLCVREREREREREKQRERERETGGGGERLCAYVYMYIYSVCVCVCVCVCEERERERARPWKPEEVSKPLWLVLKVVLRCMLWCSGPVHCNCWAISAPQAHSLFRTIEMAQLVEALGVQPGDLDFKPWFEEDNQLV
jgi:hypothetical protein